MVDLLRWLRSYNQHVSAKLFTLRHFQIKSTGVLYNMLRRLHSRWFCVNGRHLSPEMSTLFGVEWFSFRSICLERQLISGLLWEPLGYRLADSQRTSRTLWREWNQTLQGCKYLLWQSFKLITIPYYRNSTFKNVHVNSLLAHTSFKTCSTFSSVEHKGEFWKEGKEEGRNFPCRSFQWIRPEAAKLKKGCKNSMKNHNILTLLFMFTKHSELKYTTQTVVNFSKFPKVGIHWKAMQTLMH